MMTEAEFESALKKGLGICSLAVRKDPPAYRDALLRACREPFVYDLPAEGTRAPYLFGMFSFYQDRLPFLREIKRALEAAVRDARQTGFCPGSPDFSEKTHAALFIRLRQSYELLQLFSDRGFAEAEAAVTEFPADLLPAVTDPLPAPEAPVPLLIPQDILASRTKILLLLKKYPDTEDPRGPGHILYASLLQAASGCELPQGIPEYLYRNSHCPICRERLLAVMHRSGLLTHQRLKECMFDSNGGIRSFARMLLQKKASK